MEKMNVKVNKKLLEDQKEKPLTQEQKAEQFRKHTEGLDRVIDKLLKRKRKGSYDLSWVFFGGSAGCRCYSECYCYG